jgi:hypothetical protein
MRQDPEMTVGGRHTGPSSGGEFSPRIGPAAFPESRDRLQEEVDPRKGNERGTRSRLAASATAATKLPILQLK